MNIKRASTWPMNNNLEMAFKLPQPILIGFKNIEQYHES